MKSSNLIALVLVGLGLLLANKDKLPLPGPITPPAPIVAPAADLQAVVAPVKAFAEQKQAKVAAQFYRDFADVLNRDTSALTIGQFRNAHAKAQTLAFQRTEIVGAMPGLSAAIDAVLAQSLGKEDVALPRQKAVDTLNAIAWALGG